jgi:hypothetical protein
MTGACRTAANPAPASARAMPSVLAVFIVLLVVRLSVPVSAQTVEFAPLAGYRFGGDLFELVTNRPVDLDGAPVVGGAVNVDMEASSCLFTGGLRCGSIAACLRRSWMRRRGPWRAHPGPASSAST